MEISETRKQELGRRLVDREILCCVSSLMSGVQKLLYSRKFEEAFEEDSDSVNELFVSRNYESTARDYIDAADMADLETIVEEYGYWGDMLAEVGETITNKDVDLDASDALTLEGLIDESAELTKLLREKVAKLVEDSAGAWKWICNEFNLDPDFDEVYEHWIVTSWLARKLAACGEITGEFAGLTIWGRCTTGQAICLDGVIQSIAIESYGEDAS